VSALDALKVALAQGEPLRELTAMSKPGEEFILARSLLRASGFGPALWDMLPEVQLDAPSVSFETAVRSFQASRGLAIDGIVGPQTWGRLAQAIPPAQPPGAATTLPAHAQLRAELVRQAVACLGIREQGANRGPAVEALQREGGGKPGDAWCAEFCAAVLGRACRVLGIPVPFKVDPNVETLAREATAAGRARPAVDGQIGDLLLLGRLHGSRPDYFHVGLIVGGGPQAQFETIEGNTNVDGSAEGDGVYRKQRQAAQSDLVVDVTAVGTLSAGNSNWNNPA